jgi:general secretion pathway protein A
MYETFYGLKERAFSLSPDSQFLFLNDRSRAALEQILYGIERREAFACLIGDVGTGKTTLCWAILEKLAGKNVRSALIQNPILSQLDILRSILTDLGARPSSEAAAAKPEASAPDIFNSGWLDRMDKKQLIDCFNAFLAERAERNEFTVLIIDESQDLSVDMLEQLRLLSNMETAKTKLLQIILVGQPELDEKLKLPELRQLNQRISVRFETKRLTRADTEKYIFHRLTIAGGSPYLQFGRGALDAVYEYSGGYPRLINLICDRALLAGYNKRSRVITKTMIGKAAMSLKGKKEVVLHKLSDWILRRAPFAAAAMFMIGLSILYAWKNESITQARYEGLNAPMVHPAPVKLSEKPQIPAAAALPAPQPEAAATRANPAIKQPLDETPGTPSAPIKQGENIYVLQVHSFLTADRANPAMMELKREGHPSYVQYEINSDNKNWYVVYAGPFDDRDTAHKIAAELSDRHSYKPVVRVKVGKSGASQ